MRGVAFPQGAIYRLIENEGVCSVEGCTCNKRLRVHHILHRSDTLVPPEIRGSIKKNGEVTCKTCEPFAHKNGLLSGVTVRNYWLILNAIKYSGWPKIAEQINAGELSPNVLRLMRAVQRRIQNYHPEAQYAWTLTAVGLIGQASNMFEFWDGIDRNLPQAISPGGTRRI